MRGYIQQNVSQYHKIKILSQSNCECKNVELQDSGSGYSPRDHRSPDRKRMRTLDVSIRTQFGFLIQQV